MKFYIIQPLHYPVVPRCHGTTPNRKEPLPCPQFLSDKTTALTGLKIAFYFLTITFFFSHIAQSVPATQMEE